MSLITTPHPLLLCHVPCSHAKPLVTAPCPPALCHLPGHRAAPEHCPHCALLCLLCSPEQDPRAAEKGNVGREGFPPHSTPFLLLLIPLIFHFFSLAATTHPGCLERSWHRGVPHGDPQIPGSLELHSPQLKGEQSSRWQRGLRLLPADIQPRFPQH